MKGAKWSWLACILAGGALGLVASAVLAPYIMDGRGPAAVTCLLCTALGATLGAAALPFADNGPALLRCSLIHLGATALEVSLLLWVSVGLRDGRAWALWMGILVLVYALIWLGRWVGWYAEVRQLRALLGLSPGPSPLKWRETLPYLPFALILCDVLPVLLRWAERELNGGWIDVPVLSGLLLPCLILPAAGFCSGLSLGKRQGLCPLYPLALALCYLPMVFALYNASALFLCLMSSLPALVGNAAGWLWRRSR